VKFDKNRSSDVGDITVLVNPRWRLSRHLGSSSNVKTYHERILTQLRRSAKFIRNWSSYSGDISGVRKSKMAAQPPSWSEFKGQNSSGTYLLPKCNDLLNLVKISQAMLDILHFYADK